MNSADMSASANVMLVENANANQKSPSKCRTDFRNKPYQIKRVCVLAQFAPNPSPLSGFFGTRTWSIRRNNPHVY
jgi:hypothetical protein